MNRTIDGMKKCGRCGEIKPISEFYQAVTRYTRKDGNTITVIYPFHICKCCKKKVAYRHKRPLPRESRMTTGVCKTLKIHHEMLQSDSERLSTAFMRELLGVKCRGVPE